MNELALRYCAAYQVLDQAKHRMQDAVIEVARASDDVHALRAEILASASDEVLYFEGYDDTVIVVSKTILEVCHLHKETT